MAKNVAISISASNIGPLDNLSYTGKKKSSNTTLIYARNGTGKTFVSRMFRLFEDEASAKTENLLTFGKRSGNFDFGVSGADESIHSKVDLKAGSAPKITCGIDCLIHVFNSDYVREAVEKSGYTAPSGIGGYIVGKGNVDADKERNEVTSLVEKESDALSRIQAAVDKVRDEVKEAGVGASLGAFKEITLENVLIDPLPMTDTYEAQRDSLKKLLAIPDDDPQLILPKLEFDAELTKGMRRVLATPCGREDFAEEFIDRVNSHIDFVRAGVAAMEKDDTACPFCGQSIGSDASSLIHRYEEYLNAAEAKARAEIERLERQLCDLDGRASQWGRSAYLASTGLHEAIEIYPSLRGSTPPHNPGPDTLITAAKSARSALFDKEQNIDAVLPVDCAEALETAVAEIHAYESQMAGFIDSANKAKANVAAEKKECKNLLCKQARARLRISLDDDIKEYNRLKGELSAAKERLQSLEEKNREPKGERVAKIFGRLLVDFFGDKYSFDATTFTISLGPHEMSDNNDLVLSEGEKTIIAFCIYLASTVELVDNEDDWGRLFFVIDDPISSLDYDFVYTMVGCIADIKGQLDLADNAHPRLFVLTHNYSFFNILATNGIASNLLVLERGKIREASDDEIFPFEQHLADVIRVADGIATPTHSTGNSVRHVIEWAWHIQRPDLDGLGKYLGNCSALKSNPTLYSICNDFSHGGHERVDGCFDDDLITACKTVRDFMDDEFAGQTTRVRARFVN